VAGEAGRLDILVNCAGTCGREYYTTGTCLHVDGGSVLA
jgi:hypothetical protein